MSGRHLATKHRSALSLGLLALLGMALTGCLSPEQQRQADFSQDGGTCSDFGARYGSPKHSQCMLVQQQRRDAQVPRAMEMARISSEIARNNQEVADRRDDD